MLGIMSKKKFSVHKSVVLSNRKALALYLFNQNRAQDVPDIMSQLIDLDGFDGDRIPLEVVTDDINLAASILQDEFLGLKIINLIDIELLPLYKGIKQCIEIFDDSESKIPSVVLFRLVARYFKVITESVQVRFIEDNESVKLEFSPSITGGGSIHQLDGAMLGVHKILQVFGAIKPNALTISYRQSERGTEIYKQLFSIPVQANEFSNSLSYELPASQRMVLESGEKSSSNQGFIIAPLQSMLDREFPESGYTERCHHILMTIIGLVEPTREQVAQVLNMSVSSLQRRLREEGGSFQRILLDTRKELAREYLIEKKMTASNVAFLLGYQSTSQFFKAFKTWFGMTPMEYQNSAFD
jgi:AraC-like DNA-binding protein